MIHLNYAAAGQLSTGAFESMASYLRLERDLGSYEAEDYMRDFLGNARAYLGKILGAERSQVALLQSSSLAYNAALSTIEVDRRSVVITTEFEYAGNLVGLLQIVRKNKCKICVVRSTATGDVDLCHLESLIDKYGQRIALISVTHLPTANACTADLVSIGTLIKQKKATQVLSDQATYIADCCQSFCQLPISLNETGCDFLTACSRKYLCGPRGYGILFIRKGLFRDRPSLEPFPLTIHGARILAPSSYTTRRDAGIFESWEGSRISLAGLTTAAEEYNREACTNMEMRHLQLAAAFRSWLSDRDDFVLRDVGSRKSGLVSFNHTVLQDYRVERELRNAHLINVSVSERDLTPIYMHRVGLRSVVRASFHRKSTHLDLEHLISALEEISL